MTKSDDLSKTYLRFLNLVSAIKGLPTLDAVEERVLNGLASTWAAGAKVTVLEAMELGSDTSPSTVHRRLKGLRKKGLIEFRADEADNRIKYIMPTELAKGYFAKLGQCLDMATRGQ
jgi:predicted transcriptional regulator